MAKSVASGVEWVYLTAPDEETAVRLARSVLEEKLAACANLLGAIRSLYRWQGELHDASEVAVMLKTTPLVAARLVERLGELHPYEVPCILTFSAEKAAIPFEAWVAAEVAD